MYLKLRRLDRNAIKVIEKFLNNYMEKVSKIIKPSEFAGQRPLRNVTSSEMRYELDRLERFALENATAEAFVNIQDGILKVRNALLEMGAVDCGILNRDGVYLDDDITPVFHFDPAGHDLANKRAYNRDYSASTPLKRVFFMLNARTVLGGNDDLLKFLKKAHEERTEFASADLRRVSKKSDSSLSNYLRMGCNTWWPNGFPLKNMAYENIGQFVCDRLQPPREIEWTYSFK